MAFERAAPFLAAALSDARPLYTLADVRAMLETNEARLWSGERAHMLTQVQDFPTGERVLDVWLAGGDLAEIMDGRLHVERWAAEAGCTQVHVTGRDGWARLLRGEGYEPYTRTVRKVLV